MARTLRELKPTPEQRRSARVHAILIGTAFVLFWIPVVIFARLAGEVAEREPIPTDITIISAIHRLQSAPLDSFFLFFTAIGQPLVLGAVVLVLLGFFVYKHWYRKFVMLAGGVGGALVANLVLKGLFARARPSLFYPLVHETSYSFPSGHAMVSSAFVCTIILLVWRTPYRWPAVILGFLLTFLIGLSRIYLGVHYPSDVLAGWCVGLVWAVLTGSLVLNRPFALLNRLAPRLHR